MHDYAPVCKSDELKDNSMRMFKVGNTEVLVGRLNGRLFACNNSCPHRGASLSKGEFNGDNIVCYMHKYEYNVFTGRLENMKSWKKKRHGWSRARNGESPAISCSMK